MEKEVKKVELKFEKLGGKKFKSLTNEDMLKISGGRKTVYVKDYSYTQRDCPASYDTDRVCFDKWTTTTTYEVNIFGKATQVGEPETLHDGTTSY
ncbi:MAG: hypothetical protein LBV69_07255 [Bacteroidales bacterium]|jgi:hypothetical protein|nr:hypothetical protein [Bacteroidales bacterium]